MEGLRCCSVSAHWIPEVRLCFTGPERSRVRMLSIAWTVLIAIRSTQRATAPNRLLHIAADATPHHDANLHHFVSVGAGQLKNLENMFIASVAARSDTETRVVSSVPH